VIVRNGACCRKRWTLFDNGRRGAAARRQQPPAQVVVRYAQGKQALRQNLLGSVDLFGSFGDRGRSRLKLHQCGLPENGAQLFKYSSTTGWSNAAIAPPSSRPKIGRQRDPVVWDILEEVIKDHPN
jgi:DNA-directed RNA polymerase subunit beta'